MDPNIILVLGKPVQNGVPTHVIIDTAVVGKDFYLLPASTPVLAITVIVNLMAVTMQCLDVT
jgi:hypothetical protein